ncbi:MAG: acyloxyacyl hydrolase [Salinivirgaceae bacterium]|jgi:hypothetical protein|nr:acyloxyacyl hydrolase [Salinivirgaceae bacterium]
MTYLFTYIGIKSKHVFLKFAVLLMLLSLIQNIFCQNKIDNPVFFRTSAHYGFVNSQNTILTEANPRGIEFEAGKILLDEKYYANCNCFSQAGLSLKYHNLGNSNVLGEAITLAIFAEPYMGYKNKIFGSIKAGTGISYLTKVFDSISNPENIFFSSPVSFYLGLQLAINVRISKKSIIRTGISYNHISNSGLKEPNKGMNYPTFSIEYQYTFKPINFPEYPKESAYLDKKWSSQLTGVVYLQSILATQQYQTIKKWVYGLEFFTTRRLSNINGLLLGIESYYDRAATQSNIDRTTDYPEAWISLSIGNMLLFGKLSFTQQLCYSITKPPYDENPFFQRYTFYFRIKEHIKLGASFKAHNLTSDQMDIRIGWVLN